MDGIPFGGVPEASKFDARYSTSMNREQEIQRCRLNYSKYVVKLLNARDEILSLKLQIEKLQAFTATDLTKVDVLLSMNFLNEEVPTFNAKEDIKVLEARINELSNKIPVWQISLLDWEQRLNAATENYGTKDQIDRSVGITEPRERRPL